MAVQTISHFVLATCDAHSSSLCARVSYFHVYWDVIYVPLSTEQDKKKKICVKLVFMWSDVLCELVLIKLVTNWWLLGRFLHGVLIFPPCGEFEYHKSYWQHSFLQQRCLSQQSIHQRCSPPAHQHTAHRKHLCCGAREEGSLTAAQAH